MKKIVIASIVGMLGSIISLVVLNGRPPYTIHAILNPASVLFFSMMKVYDPNLMAAFIWTVIVNSFLFGLAGAMSYYKKQYRIAKFALIMYASLYLLFVVGVFVFESFIVR